MLHEGQHDEGTHAVVERDADQAQHVAVFELAHAQRLLDERLRRDRTDLTRVCNHADDARYTCSPPGGATGRDQGDARYTGSRRP